MSMTIERAPLTEEQRRFVEDNHKLIWWYINTHPMPQSAEITGDDWYCIIAEALVVAVIDWDRFPELKEKCTFSTVFATIANGRVKRQMYRDNAIKRNGLTISLDMPSDDTEGAGTIGLFIPDVNAEFAKGVEEAETCRRLLTKSGLSDRERGIVNMWFGFDGCRHSLDEIGSVYGISRERARQLKEGALDKLRFFAQTGRVKTTEREERSRLMVRDYQEGMSLPCIAAKYGIARSTAQNKLRELGLLKNNRRKRRMKGKR